ncbi:galactose-3-O-sulfotransferase 2-like [Heptranchias perlo]|uniref:galactose-3-O-sulfotransferase 2-like n=1 Tax=Heptranchias perlo TaxID=212740 RepID=UPI00355A1314
MLWCLSTRSLQLILLIIVLTSLSFTIRTVYNFKSRGNENSLDLFCNPKKHVLFLKIHKAGSSTILNILYRYGEARGLKFALPLRDHLGYPRRFKAGFVKNFTQNHTTNYNIICNHMRFNLPEVKKVMPNRTFYFSIIRNPVHVAESSFAYYKDISSAFDKVESLSEFVSNPAKYYSPAKLNSHYSRNLMWFDFGYDNNAEDTHDYVDAAILELERTFDLVLISEYFDESLVLLKEALCWEMKDVSYFKLNARTNASVVPISPAMAEKVQAWNSLDWKLYRHFNGTFWQRVASYGPERMRRDVAHLRTLRERLMGDCLESSSPVAADQIKEEKLRPPEFGKAKILSYVLKSNLTSKAREFCQRMVMPEKYYLDLLHKKQLLPLLTRLRQSIKAAGVG